MFKFAQRFVHAVRFWHTENNDWKFVVKQLNLRETKFKNYWKFAQGFAHTVRFWHTENKDWKFVFSLRKNRVQNLLNFAQRFAHAVRFWHTENKDWKFVRKHLTTLFIQYLIIQSAIIIENLRKGLPIVCDFETLKTKIENLILAYEKGIKFVESSAAICLYCSILAHWKQWLNIWCKAYNCTI